MASPTRETGCPRRMQLPCAKIFTFNNVRACRVVVNHDGKSMPLRFESIWAVKSVACSILLCQKFPSNVSENSHEMKGTQFVSKGVWAQRSTWTSQLKLYGQKRAQKPACQRKRKRLEKDATAKELAQPIHGKVKALEY